MSRESARSASLPRAVTLTQKFFGKSFGNIPRMIPIQTFTGRPMEPLHGGLSEAWPATRCHPPRSHRGRAFRHRSPARGAYISYYGPMMRETVAKCNRISRIRAFWRAFAGRFRSNCRSPRHTHRHGSIHPCRGSGVTATHNFRGICAPRSSPISLVCDRALLGVSGYKQNVLTS